MTISAEATPSAQPVHPWVAEGNGRIRFGIAYGPRSGWSEMRSFVQLVEALGFDSYWTMDHPVSGFGAWSSLAALAAVTTRVRLGPLVSCIFYRSPAMLARLAADVDQVSEGRLVLGLGGGNHAREFEKLGIAFPGTVERLTAVEETLRCVLRYWGDDSVAVDDDPVLFRGNKLRPGPCQQPYVPVLIAGGGEKITLRQVAEYADASNFSPHVHAGSAFSTDDVRRKLEVLHAHCRTFGRPYESLLKTQVAVPVVLAETPSALADKVAAIPERIRQGYESSTLAGLPEDIVAYYQKLIRAGITYFIAGIYGNDHETVRLLAERVVPHVRCEAAD
jgi:alkanesulfonate monooxygenase SsuD/methylene tetrahydromethanopterin reductase-like flavin-dependent oxidoreductase (luciferase family)